MPAVPGVGDTEGLALGFVLPTHHTIGPQKPVGHSDGEAYETLLLPLCAANETTGNTANEETISTSSIFAPIFFILLFTLYHSSPSGPVVRQ